MDFFKLKGFDTFSTNPLSDSSSLQTSEIVKALVLFPHFAEEETRIFNSEAE